MCNVLDFNHLEVDTLVLLHIISAKNAIQKECIVECYVTDVLVLLSFFKSYLTLEIWM